MATRQLDSKMKKLHIPDMDPVSKATFDVK